MGKNNFDFLKKLNALFNRKEKTQFFGLMIAALATALFQMLSIASILPFVNLVMDPGSLEQSRLLKALFTFFKFSSVYSFTVFLGFVMIGIIVISNFVFIFATWLKIRFIWQKNHNLSMALLRKYLSLPYVYFLDKHSADLGKNILSEVEQLTARLFMPLLGLITSSIVALVIFTLLLFVNSSVTLVALLLFALFYGVIFFYLRGSLKEKGERRLKENTGRFISAGEALEGIKDIKILGREKYFLERFSGYSINFSKVQAWSYVITCIPRYLMEIVAFGGVIALILILMASGENKGQIIPLVSLFVFAGYRLMPALQDIFHSFASFQFNKAVLNKVYKDIHEGGIHPDKDLDNKELPDPLVLEESISFANVSFLYPNRKDFVLRDINFQVKRGVSIGIVGPTGGGKTTLVDLILGLLTPTKGTIKVDGVEVKKENVRNWQRNIGYVPQQIYLSDDTIARNIAFGIADEQIDMIQVKRVSKIANIDAFIEKELPFGYDTFIGERGIRLSGGQKQRIGIARALYHDPGVLVLDEATSFLDGTTEKAVLEAIKNVTKLKTFIIVTHRFKTVEHCDMLYFIDKGKIVVQGTYKDLLKDNLQFQEMVNGYKKKKLINFMIKENKGYGTGK